MSVVFLFLCSVFLGVFAQPVMTIPTSTPSSVTGAIGLDFAITSTVGNTGSSDAADAYICLQDHNNAEIQSVVLNSVTLTPDYSLANFTCFSLGPIPAGGALDVVENWSITSCAAPVLELQRKATFFCNATIDCANADVADFPSTSLKIENTIDPLEIKLLNNTEISMCAEQDVVSFTIINRAGNSVPLQDVKVLIETPAGLNFDFSTLSNVAGGATATQIGNSDTVAISTIADMDSSMFTIELSADCAIEGTSLNFKTVATWTPLCEGAQDMTMLQSNPITVKFPDFTIFSNNIEGNLRPNQNVYDAIFNVNDTIKVPFINAGAGSVDSFVYYVINSPDVENVDVLINGVSLEQIGVSGDTTFYNVLSADIINAHQNGFGNGDGDGFLDENETMKVCEVWRGIKCNFSNVLPISRQIDFGCNGQKGCVVSDLSTTGVDYSYARPYFNVQRYWPYYNNPTCYMDEGGSNGFILVNTGNAPAKDVEVALRGYWASFIDTSGIFVSKTETGGALDYTTTYLSSPSACVGENAYRYINVKVFDVDLMPGDTLFVKADLLSGCNCDGCGANVNYINYIRLQNVRTTSLCNTSINYNYYVDGGSYNYFYSTGFIDTYTSDNTGGCINYQILSHNSSWFGLGGYFRTVLDVMPGLDVSMITVKNADGTPYVNNVYDVENFDNGMDNDSVSFKTNFFLNSNHYIEICYDVDCSEVPAGCGSTASIGLETYHIAADTCNVLCEEQVECPESIIVDYFCEPCEPCDGVLGLYLDIYRTNYGYLDANMDRIPDDTMTRVDRSNGKWNRFRQGDSLRVDYTGIVLDDPATPVNTYNNGYMSLDVQTTNFFILGGTLRVVDASTGNELICNTLSQFADGTRLITDISPATLAGLGCTDFAGFQYEVGDSIFMEVNFSPKNAYFGTATIPVIFSPSVYLANTPYGQGDIYSCNQQRRTLQKTGLNYGTSLYTPWFGGCALSYGRTTHYSYTGFSQLHEYPNEIRGYLVPEKIQYIKPSGFVYEPAYFSFVAYLWDPYLYQGNFNNSTIQDYYTISGDTVTFAAKDFVDAYLPRYVWHDEGLHFHFYAHFRGTCETPTQYYYPKGVVTYDVADEVFGQDKLIQNLNGGFRYYGGAQLEVSTINPEVYMNEPQSCVEIEITNTSQYLAANTWLHIESLTGGLSIASLTEISTNTVYTPNQFGIYQLGNTNGGGERAFELCVDLNQCVDQQLSFSAGYSCSAYPETIEEGLCASPSTIDFLVAESKLQTQLLEPVDGASYDLCDTIDFQYRFISTSTGNVKDIILDFELPLDMTYVPMSFEIAYPVPTSMDTVYMFVEDPVNIIDNKYRINVTSLNTLLDSTGLIGSFGGADNLNVLLVRWKTVTECGYLSGSIANFEVNAQSACGDNLDPILASSSPIYLNGILPLYAVNFDLADIEMNACDEEVELVTFNLSIAAAPNVMTLADDSIRIRLPYGVSYVDMSYMGVTNAFTGVPTVLDDNGTEILTFPMVEGLVDMDQIVFTAEFMIMDVSQSCSNDEIIIQSFNQATDNCGMVTCQVGALTGQSKINIVVQKPDLEIVFTDFTLTLDPTNDPLLTYSIKVMNNGTIPLNAGNSIQVEFWEDVDMNGSLDTLVDTKIHTESANLSIGAGLMQFVNGTQAIPSPGVCNILTALRPETSCICNTTVSNPAKVDMENTLDLAYEICSGDTIKIGSLPNPGIDYKWKSVEGSSLTNLSGTDTTQVDATIENFNASNLTVKYELQASLQGCYTKDTVAITVFPDINNEVDLNACEGLFVVLPGPSSGTNFSWTPTTGLNDPNIASPTLNPVPSGTNAYTLNYTDNNGCEASKIVNVTGVACSPNTAIGDTVWYDANSNGVQDMGEIGIPGMVVNLYNSTNTTPGQEIASTMTDANGRYYFSNIPSGNYRVRFVPLAGYFLTYLNFGGDDTKDSDADANGLTGNIYVGNGQADTTVDAGLRYTCDLELTTAEVSACLFDGTNSYREVSINASWDGAVSVYDFNEGKDTIYISIGTDTVKIEILEAVGDSTVVIPIYGSDATLTFEGSLKYLNTCTDVHQITNLDPCTYDLALRKQVVTPAPFATGDTIKYNIIVYNQGGQDITNIVVRDTMGSGLMGIDALNPNWIPSGGNVYVTSISRLNSMENDTLEFYIELGENTDALSYHNIAEIASMADTLANDVSNRDPDSTPDNIWDNDAGGVVNSPSDDAIDGDGSGMPGDLDATTDEDDSDPALINVVDLALRKTAPAENYIIGSLVDFSIEIFNQGNVPTTNVLISDYMPMGFEFDAANNPGWALVGANLEYTITDIIQPLSSHVVSLKLRIVESTPDQYTNVAEITSFTYLNGVQIEHLDLDSAADNINGNDAGGAPNSASDDAIDGDGTGMPGDTDALTDEDDSDPAMILFQDFTIEKSTVGVVPAQSGIVGNYDVTFRTVVENIGSAVITNLEVQDNLLQVFGNQLVGISSMPMLVAVTDTDINPYLSPTFDGVTDLMLLQFGTYQPGQQATVQMTVEIMTDPNNPSYINTAVGTIYLGSGTLTKSDTAAVAIPNCELVVACPNAQVNLTCIKDIPTSGSTVAWFNAIDGLSAITSACGIPTVTVTDSIVNGTGCETNPYKLYRKILINDPGMGNLPPMADSCTIEYIVIDDEKPTVMNAPTDLYVDCGSSTLDAEIANWTSNNGNGMFVDGCGDLTVTFTEGTAEVICGSQTTTPYTFTAEDACGNTISYVANVVLVDNTPPEVIVPSNEYVACTGNTNPTKWLGEASATDLCDNNPTVIYSLISHSFTCKGDVGLEEFLYSFVAVDACGNTSLPRTSRFTITYEEDPKIEAPSDLEVTCDQNIALLVATWLDDYTVSAVCGMDSDITVTHDYDATKITDLCGGTIPVTWTAIGLCGRKATATANIIIADDVTGPEMMCQDTFTFNVNYGTCGAYIALPLPLATDCNGVDSVKQIVPLLNEEFPIGFTTVTFEAYDGCGNVSLCTSVVEIIDSENPTVQCPGNLDVCTDPGVCSYTGTILLNPIGGDCSGLMYTYEVTTPAGVVETPTMLEGHVFSVGLNTIKVYGTDNATPPNVDSCTYLLTVSDCEAPQIICEDELNVPCNQEDLSAWVDGIVSRTTDNCSLISVDTLLLTDISSCGETFERVYLFTATDSTGNQSTCTATYKTVDNNLPVIDNTNKQDYIFECDGSSVASALLGWLNNNAGATATDGCGEITWSNNYNGAWTEACGSTGEIIVLFTATDACGNENVTSATFRIVDETEPELTVPSDISLECASVNMDAIISNWLSTAYANDACNGVVAVTNDYNVANLNPGCDETSGGYVVTFTAQDSCGNIATDMATISIVDNEAPEITTQPEDLVVDCGLDNTAAIDAWITSQGGAVANDDCNIGALTWINESSVTNGCGNTSITKYVFTVSDICGNTTIAEANIVVQDTTPPTIVVEAINEVVDCDGLGNGVHLDSWLASNGGASAADLCGTVTWSYDLVKDTDLCNITGIQTYRFTVSDACGNTSTTEATFAIQDTTPPAILGGADYAGECDQSGANNDAALISWLNNNAGATASDLCGSISWSNNYNIANWVSGCNESQSIDVTFTATDLCGNTSAVTFNFSTGDNTAPQFVNCPKPPVIVDAPIGWCSSYVNFSLPIATDNCGTPVVTQTDTTNLSSGSLFPVGTTVLEFTATDACGNETTCEMLVIVNDYHTPPTITCPNDTAAVADPMLCGAVIKNIAPSATDNCTENTVVTYKVINNKEVVKFGFDDASGETLPAGINTVEYCIQDQPVLLITEVLQDGTTSGVEIGNFGAASLEIGNALLIRTENGIEESFAIPYSTILAPGEVYTQVFSSIAAGVEATYTLKFIDRIIDEATINGALIGEGIFRNSLDKGLTADNFILTSVLVPNSFNVWNSNLPIATDNGTMVSLQSEDPSITCCTFAVEITDVEAPSCAQFDTIVLAGEAGNLIPNTCVSKQVYVPAGVVGEVSIENLNINIVDASKVTATLTSPSGTSILLFDQIGTCAGTAHINMNLSDMGSQSVLTAGCDPLGNMGTFRPIEKFKMFYNEEAQGNWVLDVCINDPALAGIVNGWNLVVNVVEPYEQNDITTACDSSICSSLVTWTHPILYSNCCDGKIEVTYTFTNDSLGTSYEVTELVHTTSGLIQEQGKSVSRVFDVGTTVVEYVLTDNSGNKGFCGFTVEVLDTEAPMISDCHSFDIQLNPGECSAALPALPTMVDNCGVSEVYYTTPSGDILDPMAIPVGNNTVIIHVVDIYGNESTCSIEVNIAEYSNSNNTISCNNEINISLNPDCLAMITADMMLEGNQYGCVDNYCIVIVDANGVEHENLFDSSDVGQTFKVSIVDCNGTGNLCWGYINIEDKLAPEIACPADTILMCNVDPEALDQNGQLKTGELQVLTCEPSAQITYIDDVINGGNCGNPRAQVFRTWKIVDESGNEASCVQKITIMPFELDLITFPDDYIYDKAISCADVAKDASLILPDHTGYPKLNGESVFGQTYCDNNVGYWDEILQDGNCPSAYSILRHWIVENECLPFEQGKNPLRHVQRIKVEDNQAPTYFAQDTIFASTSPWTCSATVELPTIIDQDDCSGTAVDWYVSYGKIDNGVVTNVLKGSTQVTAYVKDDCGNQQKTDFTIYVEDKTPPVIVSETFRTIALSSNGVGKLFAKDLDDGSYDNCGDIGFAVKRVDGGALCAPIDQYLPAGDDNTQLNEMVHFCCSDVGDTIQVVFSVCDDSTEDGLFNDADNCNEVMVDVLVQDKLPPVITCPENQTISCVDVTGIDWDNEALLDSLFGKATAYATCDLEVTTSIAQDIECPDGQNQLGVVIRSFTATTNGGSNSCQQVLTIVSGANSALTCDRIALDTENPVFSSLSSSNKRKFGFDDPTESDPYAGFESWWCAVNDNENDNDDDIPALEIDCDGSFTVPNVIVDIDGLCTEAGISIKLDTFFFAGGACRKYLVKYEVIDQCKFDENFVDPVTGEINPYHSKNGYYSLTLEVDAFDNTAPEIDCDPLELVADECEGYKGSIPVVASDNCTESAYFGYQWRLDIDNDGTVDYPSTGWYDTKEVSATNLGLDYLPIGVHAIFWTVSDGCGNTNSCTKLINISESTKPPTPYCYEGIATAIMPSTGSLEVFAQSFDAGSFDDCGGNVTFKIIPEADAVQSINPYLDAQNSWVFDCDAFDQNGIYALIEVRIYVTDADGNYDYCTTTLRIDDTNDVCPDVNSSIIAIEGSTKNVKDKAIANVDVILAAPHPEYPVTDVTPISGAYNFEVPQFYDYTIKPTKDKNYLNGVTTLDIVLIQKHILGINTITDPYVLIAADVNKDCKVTGTDLIHLRKLILGLYDGDKLPNNLSWRFVDAKHTFADPTAVPCDYPEEIHLPNLKEQALDQNFIGVKIGDINLSSKVHAQAEQVETRSDKTIKFDIREQNLKAGTSVKLGVTALDYFNVNGWQMAFGVDSEKATITNIESGALTLKDEHVNMDFGTNAVMISYNQNESESFETTDVLFYITVDILDNMSSVDLFTVVDTDRAAEAYIGQSLEVAPIEFGKQTETKVDQHVMLLQNEPNPFIERTNIQFYLTKTEKATINVVNSYGRIVYTKTALYDAGAHTLPLDLKTLDYSGVLIVELITDNDKIQRKMIKLSR